MSTAYSDEHRNAASAGFTMWHPGCQSAALQNVKDYSKKLGSSQTPLQTRYLATMAKAGHLDGDAIKQAWNDSHGATVSDLNKLLGIEKKSSGGSASKGRR